MSEIDSDAIFQAKADRTQAVFGAIRSVAVLFNIRSYKNPLDALLNILRAYEAIKSMKASFNKVARLYGLAEAQDQHRPRFEPFSRIMTRPAEHGTLTIS